MMPIQKTNLQDLVEKAAFLFGTRGYHCTSIYDIATYCNLSKASVYHYMPSKEALGCAVISHVHRQTREQVFKHAYAQGYTTRENLHRLAEAIEVFFTDRQSGCLIANFALEVIEVVPAFEKLIREYFNDWTETLKYLLKSKYDEKQAQILAEDSIAQLQGALMLQRIYNDSIYIKRSASQLEALL